MAQFKRRVKQLKDQAKSMGRQKSKRMVLRKRPKLTKKKPKAKKRNETGIQEEAAKKPTLSKSPIEYARAIVNEKRAKKRMNILRGTLNLQRSSLERVNLFDLIYSLFFIKTFFRLNQVIRQRIVY